ncbi:MAG: hypothetical protein LBL66_10150, partial [Clostridiales bacterium]|nr:hypothetical protein [Clostridiales bacterium]
SENTGGKVFENNRPKVFGKGLENTFFMKPRNRGRGQTKFAHDRGDEGFTVGTKGFPRNDKKLRQKATTKNYKK